MISRAQDLPSDIIRETLGDVMETLFFSIFAALILSELIKGLSANGTPPVLQRFSWQIDLAYFMWTNIQRLRSVFVAALLVIGFQLSPENMAVFIGLLVVCFALWGGIYWVFNKFWVGRYKFLPITQKVFVGAKENKVDLSLSIIGVTLNGETKAYPANVLFYHHCVSDEIGGKPILATYCGMCQSGRVYDIDWAGGAPQFSLVGAVNFNAVLRDSISQSWWRQETGECAKGARKGDQLEDVYFEQMTLANWLEKHPDTQILQYDPIFTGKYDFLGKLMNFEASFPRWYMQKIPPLVIGVEVDGVSHAYDLGGLQKSRLVNDEVAGTNLLAVSDAQNTSAFVYDRTIDGKTLNFTVEGDGMKDDETGSEWNHLGLCTKGKMKGAQLTQIQSYQQFVRAWITFHPDTSFYMF